MPFYIIITIIKLKTYIFQVYVKTSVFIYLYLYYCSLSYKKLCLNGAKNLHIHTVHTLIRTILVHTYICAYISFQMPVEIKFSRKLVTKGCKHLSVKVKYANYLPGKLYPFPCSLYESRKGFALRIL